MVSDREQYVLSLSYGKDSLACLGAIEKLGLPLDRIVHAEVWATDDIPADLPPMVEFKRKADEIIKRRWGIEVEHFCAMTTPDKKYGSQFGNVEREKHIKLTYEDMFYRKLRRGKYVGTIKGFPLQRAAWCRSLKINDCLDRFLKTDLRGYILPPCEEQEATSERVSVCNIQGGGGATNSSEMQSEASRAYGFPMRKGNWCTALKQRVFGRAPERGAENKYRSILGNRR